MDTTISTSLQAVFPVRISPWPGNVLDFLENGQGCGSNFIDSLWTPVLSGLLLKMSPDCSPAVPLTQLPESDDEASTSQLSLQDLPASYLEFLTAVGDEAALQQVSPISTPLLGVVLTLNTSVFPSDAKESSLSDILETTVPEKFYLSVTACRGIWRRAVERGKELPPFLKEALWEQGVLWEILDVGGTAPTKQTP